MGVVLEFKRPPRMPSAAQTRHARITLDAVRRGLLVLPSKVVIKKDVSIVGDDKLDADLAQLFIDIGMAPTVKPELEP